MELKSYPSLTFIENKCISQYIEQLSFFDSYANDEYRIKLHGIVSLLKADFISLNVTEKVRNLLQFIFADDEEFTLFQHWAEQNYSFIDAENLRSRLIYDKKNIIQYKLF